MTQQSKRYSQIGLCQKLMKIHYGLSISCEQMKLFPNNESITVESGEKENQSLHKAASTHTTCYCLVWSIVSFSLKNLNKPEVMLS
ncbi:hypothetical protein TNCT_181111 [Trichonephila clavata]|uniref:Uncharacterized protein n=1 Tax=Trichonephila clavata TaxID=2740835 RepID=A0A8X6FA05_TRICU|nr:hypothetical protein TNCT_181111 [Trichonephila clavata]